jgi:hypothetical protein
MPKSAKKKKPSSTNGLSSQLASLRIGPPIQTISGILGYPVLSGKWEVFDHDTDDTTVFCMMQI